MARRVNRGEIWLYTFSSPDKRRPVVVLTRQDVIDLLHTVIVAPITSAIRGVPSEVLVGADEGLKRECTINLDHIQTVEKHGLKTFVGSVGKEKLNAVCRALSIAVDCES